MNYTSLKSAKLTLAITYVFCLLLVIMMVLAYPVLSWFFGGRQEAVKLIFTVMISFYICCIPAWTALVSIIRLMRNIMSEKIFTHQNVFLIRLLSWCCAFVSLVCFSAGFLYVPMWIFALAAAFMMLILRVLKNVMARATEIKDENELTI